MALVCSTLVFIHFELNQQAANRDQWPFNLTAANRGIHRKPPQKTKRKNQRMIMICISLLKIQSTNQPTMKLVAQSATST